MIKRYYSKELYHFGILGQKWGTRKYQNEDGSYTAEGQSEKNGHGRYSDFKGSTKSHTNSKNVSKENKDKYRNEMIKRYSSKDPQLANKYRKMTDQEIQEDIDHKRKVRNAVIAASAVVGIAAAGYVAYRVASSGRIEQFAKLNGGIISDTVINDARKAAMEDLEFSFSPGDELHRVVGFKDFDISKVGKATYASFTKYDQTAYRYFLRDWSGTGQRFEVTLTALEEIKIPSKATAEEIFDKLWKEDESYRNDLKKTLIDTYVNQFGASRSWAEAYISQELNKDAFTQGIYSFVKQGSDSSKLMAAFQERGYGGIIDYFDKGSLGEAPVILFDAANSFIKTGEQKVEQSGSKVISELINLAKSDHPMARDTWHYLASQGIMLGETFD